MAGDSWLELMLETIPVGEIYDWCVRPNCGAVVLFSGTVRDHSQHRTGVSEITYEAYEDQVSSRLAEIEDEIRKRFDQIAAVALIHRCGRLVLGESSVVVAVSAAHRDAAFEAARFGIDVAKQTLPIWKEEVHDAGCDFGLASSEVQSVSEAAGITAGGGSR